MKIFKSKLKDYTKIKKEIPKHCMKINNSNPQELQT